MPDFDVVHNTSKTRFEVDLGDKKAVLIYSLSNGLFLLLHTEVPPAYEGRGIAGMLANTALEFAKQNNYKVRSYCAFTTSYLERHPEYHDLLG